MPPSQTERLRKMATELKQSVVALGPEPTAPAPHFFPEAHSAGPKLPCSGPGQGQMTRVELCSAERGRLPRNGLWSGLGTVPLQESHEGQKPEAEVRKKARCQSEAPFLLLA